MNLLAIHWGSEKIKGRQQRKPASFQLLVVLLVSLALSSSNAAGQLQIVAGTTSTIDFSNSMPSTVGTTPSTAFAALGFAPNPTNAGYLNSNAWAVEGWSSGNVVFG